MSFVHVTARLIALLTTLVGMAEKYSWYIIKMSWGFVALAVIAGLVLPNVRRYHPPKLEPGESYRWYERIPFRLAWKPMRSIGWAIAGLSMSTGLMVGSILLHAVDPRWLPAGVEKASHIKAPHISAPHISAPGGGLPGIGGALKALAIAINGSLQQSVNGTNRALGGITNAGNAAIDLGLRIRAATIAGQVAFQFGVVWLISTFLLAIIITITLAMFIFRTRHKLVELVDMVRRIIRRVLQHSHDIHALKQENREMKQAVAYMAGLLYERGIWPAGQPLPTMRFAGDTGWQDDGEQERDWHALQEYLPEEQQPHGEQAWPEQGYGPDQPGPRTGFGGLNWRR